jgi:hypothetical protein
VRARDFVDALEQGPAIRQVDAGDLMTLHQLSQGRLDRLDGHGKARLGQPPGGDAVEAVRRLGVVVEVLQDASAYFARIGRGDRGHSAPKVAMDSKPLAIDAPILLQGVKLLHIHEMEKINKDSSRDTNDPWSDWNFFVKHN